MMSDAVVVAIIAAVPVVLGMAGKTASYIISLVQDQAERTTAAIKEERDAWKERVTLVEQDNEDLREDNQLLRKNIQHLRTENRELLNGSRTPKAWSPES